jgi:hypothetical protein
MEGGYCEMSNNQAVNLMCAVDSDALFLIAKLNGWETAKKLLYPVGQLKNNKEDFQ